MSRAIHLHRSLSVSEISRLRSQILSSPSIRSLISPDDHLLCSLVIAEKLESLNRVAAVVARLSRRCRKSSRPSAAGFEHIYSDALAGAVDPSRLAFSTREMEAAVRKMERLVASTAALHAELEALDELEQSLRKLPLPAGEARKVFDQKIQWQRHDVRHLRDQSLWCHTFEKVVLLLARAIFTLYSRIRAAFCEDFPNSEKKWQLLGKIAGPGKSPVLPATIGQVSKKSGDSRTSGRLQLDCAASPGRLLMECLSLSSSSSLKDVELDEEQLDGKSYQSLSRTESLTPFINGGLSFSLEINCRKNWRPWAVGTKSNSLTALAPPSTVGGSALALHYANIIMIIEKLIRYPHLVGEEARDDLYQMLPYSLRVSLRKSLKSYVKNLAIYDAPLAHGWKEALQKILCWLVPMAHNMILWQADRNFEQHQIIQRANILLLETLYFADREKTEAVICELLVGLNYICRYEQQQNALLDCISSLDFDECVDWKVQC